jgi:polyhydroxybutyrate depolymerase
LVTTTTSTTTTSTTVPEPVINYTDVVDPIDPTLRIITTNGSKPRTYNIYIPSTYVPDKPVPLLLGFHGLGGSASTFTNSLQLKIFSQDMGFILVVPNGWGNESGSQNSWNAGNCCGASYSNQIDDIGLVRSILDSVSRRYSVDKSRIWSMGFSNGGMMSYRLACELSEQISAIGVGGGALVLNTCSPPNTVSVIHVHGGLDNTVPLDGRGLFFVKPVIESFKLVNSANACSTMTYVVTSDLTSETTGAVCSDGTEQKLTNYFNQGHEWTIDWTKEILRFLFAHPRK